MVPFLGQFSRNCLERPKEEKCNRQDNYPKIDSFMSKFTTSRPKKGRRIERNGRRRTNLDHFLVEAGDGFVRDALCADLPNLQKRCADIRLWSGFSKFSMVDSHVSRRIPNIRLKNRRTFAPFTSYSLSENFCGQTSTQHCPK